MTLSILNHTALNSDAPGFRPGIYALHAGANFSEIKWMFVKAYDLDDDEISIPEPFVISVFGRPTARISADLTQVEVFAPKVRS